MKYVLLFVFLFCSVCNAKFIRIGIMDTGLISNDVKGIHFCEDSPNITFTNDKTIEDHIFHGHNILHIITDNLKYNTYCVIMIKIMDNKQTDNNNNNSYLPYLLGYIYAFKAHLDILNLSIAGFGEMPNEKELIGLLINTGTNVVVAAGNDKRNLSDMCIVFPACADNRNIVVGSLDQKGFISNFSNYGAPNEKYEIGENICAGGFCFSGTSQATARYTRKLAIKLMKNKK